MKTPKTKLPEELHDETMDRESELVPLLPFSKQTLHRMVARGQFPAPTRLESPRVTFWRWGDVRARFDGMRNAA